MNVHITQYKRRKLDINSPKQQLQNIRELFINLWNYQKGTHNTPLTKQD